MPTGNPMGVEQRHRGLRPGREPREHRGLQRHDHGRGRHRSGVGRDGQRLDHAQRPRRRRSSSRASTALSRPHRPNRPRPGRSRERSGHGARRLGRARGLHGEREAHGRRRRHSTVHTSSRSREPCASRARSPPRRRSPCETVSGAVELFFPAGFAGDFTVSTFSGAVTNELGPAAEKKGEWTAGLGAALHERCGRGARHRRDLVGRHRDPQEGEPSAQGADVGSPLRRRRRADRQASARETRKFQAVTARIATAFAR